MPKHMHYDEADLVATSALADKVKATTGIAAVREDVGIFTARELDFVKKQVYEKKYPEMKGLLLVPMSHDAPEWAETVTYKYFDEVGMAKVIANYADDLPRADVSAKERTVRVRTIGNSYGYNIRELAVSVATGQNLPTRKATAARRAVEIKLNKTALFGDSDYNLFGLANHPNIGVVTLPSGKNWLTEKPTAMELIDDVSTMYDAVALQSNDIHTPNRFVVPTRHASVLENTIVPDSGAKTVWQFLRDKYNNVEFVKVSELGEAGTYKRGKMFMGEFDNSNLSLEIPEPFKQHPAEARNLELLVNCTASTAGVIVHYPLALVYAEA